MHHIHMFLTAPLDAQAWYIKNFGATPGRRLALDTANLPGIELSLTKTPMAQVPSKNAPSITFHSR